MAMNRVPLAEGPEFDDVQLDGLDRILIPLIMPYVWLHGLVSAPFQYRRLLATNRRIGWRPLTSDQTSGLPQHVDEFLRNMEAATGRIGFHEPVRHGDSSRPHNREAATVISIAPSASGEEFCMAAISHAPRRFSMTGLTFHTRMTDGLLIVTGNERRVAPARQGNHDVVSFPGIADVSRLYEIHQGRKALALRADRAPVMVGWQPPATHPLDLYQRMFDEATDEGVRLGYVEAPATEQVRLTPKGATLAAWSNAWPLDRILDWRERRRGARVLRDLKT